MAMHERVARDDSECLGRRRSCYFFLFERLGLVNSFRLAWRNARFSFGGFWRTIWDGSCPGFSIRVRAVGRPESRGSSPGQGLFGVARLEGLFAAEHVPAGDENLARDRRLGRVRLAGTGLDVRVEPVPGVRFTPGALGRLDGGEAQRARAGLR
jgi:hypothetical protein